MLYFYNFAAAVFIKNHFSLLIVVFLQVALATPLEFPVKTAAASGEAVENRKRDSAAAGLEGK